MYRSGRKYGPVVVPKDVVDELRKLTSSIYIDGREVPNPEPRFIDVSPVKRLTIAERVQRIIRHDLSRVMRDQGLETFDEANDFDIEGEDDAPLSHAQVMTEEFLAKQESEMGAVAPIEDVVDPQEVQKHEKSKQGDVPQDDLGNAE